MASMGGSYVGDMRGMPNNDYEGPTVEVSYGDQRTPDGWTPEAGQDTPLIIVQGGQWEIINVRQLAWLYEMAHRSDEPDYLPEAIYYAQGTVPVRGRVTIEQATDWDDVNRATFRIMVWDGGMAVRLIASGTYRVDGDR